MKNIADRKFSKSEVLDFLRRQQFEYESSLSDQKQRIFSLLKEVEVLEKQIFEFKQKEQAISSALVTAVEKSKEIEKLAKLKYQGNLRKLAIFEGKFVNYYNAVRSKYPIDDDLIKVEDFLQKMDEIFQTDNLKNSRSKMFNHQTSINMEKSVNESGFNIDEALDNAGDLEQICKELGLME